MKTVKKVIKKVLNGIHDPAVRLVNTVLQPVTILAYHRVAFLEHDPQLLAVTPKHFEEHLQCLCNLNYEILRFEDTWKSKPFCKYACLTFDDGYADNFLAALPILEKYKCPATFFITTWHVQSGKAFWWDMLDVLLEADFSLFTTPPSPFKNFWGLSAQNFYGNVHKIFLDSAQKEQERYRDLLCGWLGMDEMANESHRPLTMKEVKEFAKHPLVTLGGHTHTHPRLALLSKEQQRIEIKQSLDLLEHWTQERPTVFAYPYGTKNDYTTDSEALCGELQLQKVAANFPEKVRPWSNPYALPRHLVRNWGGDSFSQQLRDFRTKWKYSAV